MLCSNGLSFFQACLFNKNVIFMYSSHNIQKVLIYTLEGSLRLLNLVPAQQLGMYLRYSRLVAITYGLPRIIWQRRSSIMTKNFTNAKIKATMINTPTSRIVNITFDSFLAILIHKTIFLCMYLISRIFY